MDFVPLELGIMLSRVKKERFGLLQIRINTILTNLIQNTNKKSFPQPLVSFMNSFMVEGGFLPYDFLSEFEIDIIQFDKYDAIVNYTKKMKFLQIASFIIPQFLIDKVLLNPKKNGFNTEISEKSMDNLYLLGALFHAIYSQILYDLFKDEMKNMSVLLANEENRKEILYKYIYNRYKFSRKLPKMDKLEYAF